MFDRLTIKSLVEATSTYSDEELSEYKAKTQFLLEKAVNRDYRKDLQRLLRIIEEESVRIELKQLKN